MSSDNMPTIYQIVDDICMRDFDVLAKLPNQFALGELFPISL